MTTIATDGKTIAGDGLRTFCDEITGTNHKKIRIVDGKIYTFTGSAALFSPAIKWYAVGANLKALPKAEDNHWVLVVIDQSGITRITSAMPWPEQFDPPFCLGAGEDFALGAMRAGLSPEEAVRLTAKHFTHTGGEIQVVNIAEALGIVKPNGVDLHEDPPSSQQQGFSPDQARQNGAAGDAYRPSAGHPVQA